MGILVGAVHPPSLCYGAAGPNRLWQGRGGSPEPPEAIGVNRRYLIESIAATSKFIRVIRGIRGFFPLE